MHRNIVMISVCFVDMSGILWVYNGSIRHQGQSFQGDSSQKFPLFPYLTEGISFAAFSVSAKV